MWRKTGMQTSKPRWEILIPTVVDRADKFETLADVLGAQIEKYKGDVQVTVLWNNYERELSRLRQLMIESATGMYVNFIDDDDYISEDYVDQIYPKLDGKVDYVGFMVAFFQKGQKQKPVIHSLAARGWYDDEQAFYRRVTLINPTKRELMLQVGFERSDYRRGIPEDITYAEAANDIVKTEHFVNKELHMYQPTDHHAWSIFTPVEGKFKRPKLPKYFKFHPESTK